MIYLCSKLLYNAIASKVTKDDLKNSKLTLSGFICRYLGRQLNLPDETITKIRTK